MKNRREMERRSRWQHTRNAEDDTNRAKSVEFFAASVNAWYNTALEHDKSLFALSAGSIGLLVTLLTTVGVTSALMLCLYVAAIVSFLLCLAVVLVIFKGNRAHILDVVVNGTTGEDKSLARLDTAAMGLFWAGVFFAAVLGIMTAYNSYEKGVNEMTKEKQTPTGTKTVVTHDSVNGCEAFTKSFNGAGKLNPNGASGGAATTASAPSPAPAPAPAKTGK